MTLTTVHSLSHDTDCIIWVKMMTIGLLYHIMLFHIMELNLECSVLVSGLLVWSSQEIRNKKRKYYNNNIVFIRLCAQKSVPLSFYQNKFILFFSDLFQKYAS